MKNDESIYVNIHQDIIDRCKKGEQKAQFQLYKLYYKAMYNTSLRIVSDALEAEDVMQEAFLKAFDKIHTYSGAVSFGAWLKRIVINHSLDELKRRKADWEPIDAQLYKLTDEEDEKKQEEIELKAEQIKQTINLLPDGYRLVLTLYLIEGYDHHEIADILHISASTSRSQCARAKKKVIEAIKMQEKKH